jgi:hypothetical protein
MGKLLNHNRSRKWLNFEITIFFQLFKQMNGCFLRRVQTVVIGVECNHVKSKQSKRFLFVCSCENPNNTTLAKNTYLLPCRILAIVVFFNSLISSLKKKNSRRNTILNAQIAYASKKQFTIDALFSKMTFFRFKTFLK